MQSPNKTDTIRVRDGWLICPACGKHKVLRLDPETTAHKLPVFCKRCGTESIVNIDHLSLRPRA